MHCQCCDTILTDEESTRKDENGNYPDICNACLSNLYSDLYDDFSSIPSDDLISLDLEHEQSVSIKEKEDDGR